jgi:hypothetical protein
MEQVMEMGQRGLSRANWKSRMDREEVRQMHIV